MRSDVLSNLGYVLEGRAPHGESGEGAWFATDPSGRRVVLKWFDDLTVADRYAVLLPALDVLRSRGVPAPEYTAVLVADGHTLSAQAVLDGTHLTMATPQLVAEVIACNELQAGVDGPGTVPWGEFMVHTLTVGEDGWAMHAPVRGWSARAAALLDRIEAIGADADPSWFAVDGIVHLDLHAGNLLMHEDGSLAGIVDWEGATRGDHRFDLVTFGYDLAQHSQPIWNTIEVGIDARVLRAYVAHQALRLVDWQIRHHPDDVERQLALAERLFTRYV